MNKQLQSDEEYRFLKKKFPIKQTPPYDPDAEIASLYLTIPSWTATIKRTKESNSFSEASGQAKENLMNRLLSLKDITETMIQILQNERK